jgi:hypothetical protein
MADEPTMTGAPPEVLWAWDRVADMMGHRRGVMDVGLVYNGREWAVVIWWGPGPHTTNTPAEIGGVRVINAQLSELPDVEE